MGLLPSRLHPGTTVMTLMSSLMQLFTYLFYLKQQIFLWKIPDHSIIFKKTK